MRVVDPIRMGALQAEIGEKINRHIRRNGQAPRPGQEAGPRGDRQIDRIPDPPVRREPLSSGPCRPVRQRGLPRGEAMGRIAVAGNHREPGKPPAHRGLRERPALPGSGQRPQRRGDRRRKRRGRSVGAGVDAATQWDELERLFIAARCAVSNTADRGYETDPADRPDAGAAPIVSRQARQASARAPPRRRRADHAFPLRIDAGQRPGPARRGARRARPLAGAGEGAPLGRGGVPSGSIRWSTASSPSRSSLWARSPSPMLYGRSRTSPASSCPAGIRRSSSPPTSSLTSA